MSFAELGSMHPFYESDGIYILPVLGIGFETYVGILNKLEIFTAIRTDNDLRRVNSTADYSVLGFSRCNKYIGEELLPTSRIPQTSVASKRKLYQENKEKLDDIRRKYHFFLSVVDLENDLDECLHERLCKLIDKNPVKYLQDSKNYHMVELINKLSYDDCETIYNHYNFACLKEISE